jgi:hippurate hydrolase
LRHGTGNKTIGLRADMDALPIVEANTFAHRSTHAGKMHACGHDGHVAMLLAAAQHLAQHPDFSGTVIFIFQPGEESGIGAQKMINEGLFERFPCDAVFALHNWPGLMSGKFATCVGPIMASCNEFRITVTGKGAHAALPHNGADPVFALTQIVNGLQGVITRVKRPMDAAVMSVTQFHAGEATNIIPDSAWIAGTVRTFNDQVTSLIEEHMHITASATAMAHGCSVKFDFTRQSPATVNDAQQTQFAADIMKKIVGSENVSEDVEPTMGSEDFSFMLQQIPGCYAFIGNGNGNHRETGHGLGPCMLHNSSYDFNDEILPLGATYWVELAYAFLK